MLIIYLIYKLVEEGVLDREECPEPNYWHWTVLQPEKLPESLLEIYKEFGEIRWYGERIKVSS
jgi:hypothetical protein